MSELPPGWVPIPEDWEALPNPRAFEPLPVPELRLMPAEAAEQTPFELLADGLQMTAGDGSLQYARFSRPSKDPHAPVAILLHMWGQDESSWEVLAPGFRTALLDAGIAWLAPDLRGHGRSGGGLDDIAKSVFMLLDCALWIGVLSRIEGIDPKRLALIGGSVGANLAWCASSCLDAKFHVAISPWYPAPGWALMGREIPNFQPWDTLFLSDSREASQAARMLALTQGDKALWEIEGPDTHGLGLLSDPTIQREVIAHLSARL